MVTRNDVHAEGVARLASLIVVFVLLLGPLASDAQPPATVPRIGVLLHDGTPPGFLAALRAGLQDLGYFEGKNIALELRNAEGKNERLSALADELVRLGVDLLLALNTPAAIAAKKATARSPLAL